MASVNTIAGIFSAYIATAASLICLVRLLLSDDPRGTKP